MAAKTMGAAQAKAHFLRILDEVERTRQPVTITKRGKPVAEIKPLQKAEKLTFGCLASPAYRFDDPFSPAYEGPWNAELAEDEDDLGTGSR